LRKVESIVFQQQLRSGRTVANFGLQQAFEGRLPACGCKPDYPI
jgi:hypothetical protein